MLISLRLRDGSALIHNLSKDPAPIGVSIHIDGALREFQLVTGVESAMPRYREEHRKVAAPASAAAVEVGWLEAAWEQVRGRWA